MPVPILPSDFATLIPSYSGPECETLKKLLITLPTDWYLNYSAMFNEDGSLTTIFQTDICTAITACPGFIASSTTSGTGAPATCMWIFTSTSYTGAAIANLVGSKYALGGTVFLPTGAANPQEYILPATATDEQVVNAVISIGGKNYSFVFTAQCSAGATTSPTSPGTVTQWRFSGTTYLASAQYYGLLTATGAVAQIPVPGGLALGFASIVVPATGAIGQVFKGSANVGGTNYEFDFTGQ